MKNLIKMLLKKEKRKKGQGQKSKISSAILKRGQEEIGGFAVIIVLVGVIFLLFLGFMLVKDSKERTEDYQIKSFVQSLLHVTTLCEQNGENISVQELIRECQKEADCSYGIKSCFVLNSTLNDILEKSWAVGNAEEFPIQGYQLNITSYGENMVLLRKGTTTSNEYGGSGQILPNELEIYFDVYYN
jgi:hypothetical protein